MNTNFSFEYNEQTYINIIVVPASRKRNHEKWFQLANIIADIISIAAKLITIIP